MIDYLLYSLHQNVARNLMKMIVQDIISRIMAVSQINGKAICVLSVHGAVNEATLLQSSGVISNHKV